MDTKLSSTDVKKTVALLLSSRKALFSTALEVASVLEFGT